MGDPTELLGRIVEIEYDDLGMIVVVEPKDDEAREIMLRFGLTPTPTDD
jgi:hypothetical protein